MRLRKVGLNTDITRLFLSNVFVLSYYILRSIYYNFIPQKKYFKEYVSIMSEITQTLDCKNHIFFNITR